MGPQVYALMSQQPSPPACQTLLTPRVEPHSAKHSAEQPSPCGDPHELARSRFARHAFTHHAGVESLDRHPCFDGQAVNGRVLAGRAQKSSIGIADRPPVQWHMQNQAVRAAKARSVSPRCAAAPTGASESAPSAPRATSEGGTGGPATRPIEADVLPTRPGHGDACGARGKL